MEPVFTSLGARAASLGAGPLVRKILVSHAPGAGLAGRGTPLAHLVAWGGRQPKITKKDVRKLVEHLVKTTLNSDPELYHLKRNSEPLVEAVCQTLLALGDLRMDDVQAVRLRHDGLAVRLKGERPQVRNDLSEEFVYLYDTIVEICCLHVLEFFSSRPEFSARSQIETVRMLHEQDRHLLSLLERLPDPKSVDTLFEKRYADSVISRYDELTIFGLDLSNSQASWPLDTAYLSLETIRGGRHSDCLVYDPAQAPQEGGIGTDLAGDNLPQRVEAALPGRSKVLMRGVAGSGKTTLLHWLATTAARQSFTGDLAELNICIPFVLPLRTLARDPNTRLPTPDQFLHAVGNMQAGAQPSGWAQRVMDQGRGLLLIDGVDEVSAAYRALTRKWLREILKSFRHTRCIVTARPSAAPEGWLDAEDFTELALSPMRPQDVHIFVNRWHEAAKSQSEDDETRDELDSYSASLIETIDTKPDVARLATNPLMCALVCALHRDRHGRLPRGRKSLYDAALRMLLVERDDQRSIVSPEGVNLDEDDQILLLQKIAYWLIRNGLSEVEKETVQRMVESTIPHMPSVRHIADEQKTAQLIFNHLLTRSGLLRDPSTETIEFLHRTFQDYLGARAAVENEDIPYLVKQAHNDQWEDVIRMAVAHCRPKERARLLSGIIQRGDAEPEFRHRLYILALVCLEHSPELDADLQSSIRSKAGELLPPNNLEEAEVLAQVGPLLLELLPGPDGLTVQQSCAAVRSASLVGGSGGIRSIARYVSDERPAVQQEIVQAWGRFDAHAFAKSVLSRGSFVPLVTSQEQAAACAEIHNLLRVTCAGDGAVEEMIPKLPSHLSGLHIHSDRRAGDFRALSRFSSLMSLSLVDCRGITDLGQIVEACPRVRVLNLTRQVLRNLNALQDLQDLHSLDVSGNSTPIPIEEFPSMPNVMSLGMSGLFDVGKISTAFPGLKRLHISLPYDIGSMEWLRGFSELQDLHVSARDQAEGVLGGLHLAKNLTSLSLYSVLPAYFGRLQMKQILESLPRLTALQLAWAPGQLASVDVSYLADRKPRRQDGIERPLKVTLIGAHSVRGRDQVPDGSLQIIERFAH
ncbi:NACHT domain-containing protein [Streptomyces sp. NPDC051445]|uniref:NACHT domain-containing protein n=1 Tax=Streptomyces sp. NPDC051445 TaxID=3365653 RepID=UPI0037B95D94